MIRTRFAPSPTGELHIGGARTALFAYLFARHNEGEFLLRIEDTDRERFVEGSTERIIESLRWLGLYPENYDKPIIQSQRQAIYKGHALKLVESSHAYVCDCSKERLEKIREEQEKRKLPPQYDRHCRERNLKYKEGCVIRLKMPLEGEVRFKDLIRDEVKFDLALQDDPVIFKSDGFPTYHLASVVDDHDMSITHVIRAEEWLSSTPKHLVLYEAFGWKIPEFAHLPMILGPDKKKLSKRHGATSVIDYKKQGYLPEALINFIAFLGWSPKDEREEFSLEQLTKEFGLENVHKNPAVFDIDKLNHINENYIKNQKSKVKIGLADLCGVELSEGELELATRGGFKTLREIGDYIIKLRKKPEYKADLLIFKKSTREKTQQGLTAAREHLVTNTMWSEEELQDSLTQAVLEYGLSNGDVFWPVRMALSGQEKSPSPVELLMALDRTESLKRVDYAIKKLAKR